MIQKFPRPINPKLKVQTDDQLAKVGQLNQLVRDINNLNVGGTANTGIPFMDYPPACLVNEGPKFTYLPTPGIPVANDVVELISYHIKGIEQFGNIGFGFEQYLCTLRITPPSLMAPIFFPGSITGMFQCQINDVISTPLANGGLILVDGTPTPVNDFQINLYNYGGNPQLDGSYYYAVVMSGTINTNGSIFGTAMYDFEILIPNYVSAPIIFQD